MENQRHVMDDILSLTLEIISLLYGENFTAVKYGDMVSIMVPPHNFVIPEKINEKKMLEITKQIVELLTGEVPIRCQDVAVYLSMEERQYLEGHRELYKAAMMGEEAAGRRSLSCPVEEEPADGYEKRNPPDRSPRPLDSRESTQEGQDLLHQDQVFAAQRSSCSLSSQDSRLKGHMILSHYQERCSQRLQPRTFMLAEPGSPQLPEKEDLTIMADEGEEQDEETLVRSDWWSMGKVRMMVTIKEEEDHLLISVGQWSRENVKMMAIIKEEEEEESPVRGDQRSTEEVGMMMTITEEKELPVRDNQRSTEKTRMMVTIKEEESSVRGDQWSTEKVGMMVTIGEGEEPSVRGDQGSTEEMEEETDSSNIFSAYGHHVWSSAGSCLALSPIWMLDKEDTAQDSSGRTILGADIHGGLGMSRRPSSPPDHEESFPNSSDKRQTGCQKEKRLSCSECGKLFDFKSYLEAHRRSHTGERPFSCQECGKRFVHKFSLERHKKYHTPDQLLSCAECGKNFSSRSDLLRHHKSHTGEKPHTCPECGKSFVHKFYLSTHLRSHTGEKPHTCPECGKSYLLKSQLNVHLKFHAGIKPFSCSDCGKTFMWRRDLVQHLKVHSRIAAPAAATTSQIRDILRVAS